MAVANLESWETGEKHSMRNEKLTTKQAQPSDAAYADWLANLAELATRRTQDLPLSTLQIANLEALSRLFSTVLADTAESKAQWQRDVRDKNHLRKEAELHCQRYLDLILADPSVPEQLKADLGLVKPKAAPKPTRRRSAPITTSHAYA